MYYVFSNYSTSITSYNFDTYLFIHLFSIHHASIYFKIHHAYYYYSLSFLYPNDTINHDQYHYIMHAIRRIHSGLIKMIEE